jgi:hypothetical protein
VIWRPLTAAVGMAVITVGLFTQPPTQPSAAIVLFGLVALVLAAMHESVKRVSGLGFRVDTRPPAGPGRGARREDRRCPDPADPPGDTAWNAVCSILCMRMLDGLLAELRGPLDGCRARVFLFDHAKARLVPLHPLADTRGQPLEWKVGQGVTGTAFDRRRYVAADGDRLRAPGWGLDPQVQRRFANLTAVAAAPLWDRAGRVVGTLSLSSSSPGTELTTVAGRREHEELALQVAVCVAELLVAKDLPSRRLDVWGRRASGRDRR